MRTLAYVGHVLPRRSPSDAEDARLTRELRAAEKEYRGRPWDHGAEALYLQAATALYRHRSKQKAPQRE